MPYKASPGTTVKPWPTIRNAIVTVLSHTRPRVISATVELDATDAIAALRRMQRELRIALSLHAFLVYCLAKAIAETEEARTYRLGRRRLIVFDDVDINTPIDKRLPGGVRIPVGYIVRGAQAKSLAQIFWELRAATKAKDLADDPAVRIRRRFAAMPSLVRRWFAWRMTRDPLLLRRVHGTVGMTSVQSIGKAAAAGFSLIPTVHTLSLAIGAHCERLRLTENGIIERRQVVCATIVVDHDVMDGMPAALFCRRLFNLVNEASGLDEAFVDEVRGFISTANTETGSHASDS